MTLEAARTGPDEAITDPWLRIKELEALLEQTEEDLAVEQDRSARAKKKVKQLLSKLAERDAALAEQHKNLEKAREALTAMPSSPSSSRPRVQEAWHIPPEGSRSKRPERHKRREENEEPRSRGGSFSSQDLAAKERAAIVSQLEEHLVAMRIDLQESEREVKEMEERHALKEAEWHSSPTQQSPENAKALSLLVQQVQEKRRFAVEMAKKTKLLEQQVEKQRSVIVELLSGQRRLSKQRSSSEVEEQTPEADASPVAELVTPLVFQDNKALKAFLDAAGPSGGIILWSPALRAAFEGMPPELGDGALEACDAAERVQVLSLFTAWVAVASSRSMQLCDLNLSEEECSEMVKTLETCGAQLACWEMTRCPLAGDSASSLLASLASQPLRRLMLGYNALGPDGAKSLASAARSSTWTSSLEHLGLEMNGLGDRGCSQVCRILKDGLLPGLLVLELGWNELSPSSAEELVELLDGAPNAPKLSLRRLGLTGNRLSSEGAAQLALAALSDTSRKLELDLSMNHVASSALLAVASWAEGRAKEQPATSTTSLCIGLEWNVVDDASAVQKLAAALADSRLEVDPSSRQPLLRLSNNDFDAEPAKVLQASAGLLVC